MKILLILSLIIVTSCATNSKKKVSIIQGKEINEVELPVTIVDFPSPSSFLENTDIIECKQEYTMFLIKEPFESMQIIKSFYDDSIILNNNLSKLIELNLKVRDAVISIEEYEKQTMPLSKEMNDISNSVESKLKSYAEKEYKTQAFSYICMEQFDRLMQSKKVDENQDGCELQQQSSYITDPYIFKKTVNQGIQIELELSKYLTDLYRVSYQEIHNQKSSQEAQDSFLKISQELNESGLREKSLEALENVIRTYTMTIGIKDACIKRNSK